MLGEKNPAKLIKLTLESDYLLYENVIMKGRLGSDSFSWKCFSVAQSYPTLCHPMDCSTLGFPVLYHLVELAQTHVH